MLEVYLDVETTGLNHMENGIWQIGMIICYDGKEMEAHDTTLAPMPTDILDPKALEFNGITEQDVRAFTPPSIVFNSVITTLDRHINKFVKTDKALLYGYNVRFDMDFMRSFFMKNGNKFIGSYFWFPPIDVMNLAMEHLKDVRPNMPNFKQDTVAEQLGIEVDKDMLHDALYDIRLTKRIYDYVRQ